VLRAIFSYINAQVPIALALKLSQESRLNGILALRPFLLQVGVFLSVGLLNRFEPNSLWYLYYASTAISGMAGSVILNHHSAAYARKEINTKIAELKYQIESLKSRIEKLES